MVYRIWILVSALAVLAVRVKGQDRARHLVEESHVESIGNALSANGNVAIQLREVRTSTTGTKASKLLSILVMFEPKSGVYSWRVFEAEPKIPSWRSMELNEEQAAYLQDGKLIHFMALPSPLRLFVNDFSGHASDMNDAAAKALKSASESVDPDGDLDQVPGVHVISLSRVGLDFTTLPMSAAPSGVTPRVVDVQWQGKYWIVAIQARWKEAITLDAGFNLVSMAKMN